MNESMSDLPVAAPDHAETIRDALAYWSDTSIGSEEEREIHDAALAALDALLAERQQDKRLREALERIAEIDPDEWHIGSGWAAVTFVQHIARAALAVEEDAE